MLRRILLSLAFAAAIAAWMVTGKLVVSGSAEEAARRPPAERSEADAAPFRVRVREVRAEERQRTLTMRGKTRADALVAVAAETQGQIVERPVSRGAEVKPGDVLCRLDQGVREAQLAQAKAEAAKAQLDFDAASKLRGRGFESETRVASTKAALDAAQAMVATAEQELARTVVRAPIAGTVQEPLADVGTMLSIGSICATLVDLHPIYVTGQVAERNVTDIALGTRADVTLVTGESATGTVSYVSRTADQATRTFAVEVEVANDAGRLRDGVTAIAVIPIAPVKVVRLSPGVLTLDDAGRVGVRTVEAGNRVGFRPVTIAMQDSDGFWVTGLPDTVTVITVGQEYVAEGQVVEPVADEKAGA
jgi:multidrug efflux system membrane fusion protein